MPEENVELVRRLFSRWEQGDFGTAEFFDPGVTYIRVGGEGVGAPGSFHSIDEMWTAIAEWLRGWEGFRVEADQFIDLGDRVLVLGRVSARGRRSGVDVNQQNGHIFTIDDGKVVRWEDYWDRGAAQQAAAHGR